MPAPKPGTGGDAPASRANTVSSTLQGGVTTFTTRSSRFLDHYFPPQTRQKWKHSLTKFSTERPYVAGLLLCLLAISVLPVLLMTIITFVFTLLTGIFLGALGAFLFVAGVMGLASLILLPMLFFTSGAAVLIWFWGSIAILIIKWFQRKERAGKSEGLRNGLPKGSSVAGGKNQGRNGNTIGDHNASPPANRPQFQNPPSSFAQRQHEPTSTPITITSQPQNSPDSPDSPDSPGTSEVHAEGHIPQVQPRKSVPSRTPSPSPSSSPTPPQNGAAAGEHPADEGAYGLQSSQAAARTASPNPVPNVTASAQAQTNGEGNQLYPR